MIRICIFWVNSTLWNRSSSHDWTLTICGFSGAEAQILVLDKPPKITLSRKVGAGTHTNPSFLPHPGPAPLSSVLPVRWVHVPRVTWFVPLHSAGRRAAVRNTELNVKDTEMHEILPYTSLRFGGRGTHA